jgi:hypothetical protein
MDLHIWHAALPSGLLQNYIITALEAKNGFAQWATYFIDFYTTNVLKIFFSEVQVES